MTTRRNPSNREREQAPTQAPRVEFEETTPYDAYVRASTLATLQRTATDEPGEYMFLVLSQIMELYFNLLAFEWRTAQRFLRQDELGEALLNQRLVAGIGNIFKSESCFEAGLDPWRTVGTLAPDELTEVLEVAARQMERGVETGRRPGRIYRRVGQPCIRCGERVLSRGQGPESRTTYWCPGCQR
jgi:formamidopyrimidine-DNA glycosylase